MKTKKKAIRALGGSKVTPRQRATASMAGVTRKAAVSRSRRAKPRTAYGLLERVCEHILEEPRRYNQAFWGFERHVIADLPQPPCGTVCCRAGWVVALNDGTAALEHQVARRSNQILGFGGLDGEESSETNAIYYDDSVSGLTPGTKKYAEVGVAGLRRWMQKHKAHLQARVLKDV